MSRFVRKQCFTPRATRPSGILTHAGWRLKQYDITIDGSPLPVAYAEGVPLALSMLPDPAVGANRPGVGFLIRHAGDGQYIVLSWWDNQNELLQRTLVRFPAREPGWRDAAGRYSFCVWDTEVIWHERNVYVRHVMTPPTGPDINAYLDDWYRQ